MKTATFKMITLFLMMLGATSLFAQEEKYDSQNAAPAIQNQNIDEQSKLTDPGTLNSVPFTVFPNPANTVLYVRMQTDPATKSEIRIFNSLWQEMYNRDVTGLSELTVDITAYSKGLYYVRLTTGHNQIQVKKLNIVP
jgi:hypothetical protein